MILFNSIKRFAGIRFMLILLFSMPVVPAFPQLSPGKLSESHAHLEGLSNCTKCHVLGEKVSSEKCLDCHKEIASRINEQRGYHFSNEVRSNECIKCHSDHHGRNFQMIHFDVDEFDHAEAGYELLGAHAGKVCEDCHKTEFITDAKIKERKSTYLGLVQKCLSCHKDPHQGTLSPVCSSCHDNTSFSPASKFDHQKTRFKLRGKHVSVDCKSCHGVSVTNGIRMQKFAGVSFDNCTSCHKDVHNDRFGQNCIQCHSEQSFKKIKQLKNFNHSVTDYPLVGKHRYVACSSCHKTEYTATLRFARCSDCHSDYHHHEFVHQGPSPDCSDCHSNVGFDRSDFTIERHNKTDFKLSGAHLATPCFDCHKKSKRWNFGDMGKQCADCHENIHEPYMDPKFYPEETCQSCHNSMRWPQIDFDHSQTEFRLEGAHRQQSCRSCHFRTGEDGTVHQKFSGLLPGCLNCHEDVHYGQFEDFGGTDCLKCHGYSDWSASRFDHDQAAFKLDGKHNEVACKKCHIPVVSSELTYALYKLKDYSCEACH